MHHGSVLVLDNLLTTPITPDMASELLSILARREHRGSTVVTSQFHPEDWHESLHDAVIVKSILNRIVSSSTLVAKVRGATGTPHVCSRFVMHALPKAPTKQAANARKKFRTISVLIRVKLSS